MAGEDSILVDAPDGPPRFLGGALDALGDRFVLIGDPPRERPFAGVLFYDARDDITTYRGSVVLCPGLASASIAEVCARLMAADAVAVVVPGSAADDRSAAEAAGLLILRVGDWAELATVLRSFLLLPSANPVGGVRLGDLFGLAGALASLAEGAVSLVDATGQVVGYSTHADQPIDDVRRRTTLMLQEEVPLALDPDYLAVLAASGPLHFPPATNLLDGERPGALDLVEFGRVATAVRAAGEVLGTVWVVQVDDASAPRTARLLTEVMPIVAEHMLQARERADDDDRRASALLRTLVEDESQARIAASQLMIRPADGCSVVCFRLDTADSVAALRALHRLLALVKSLISTAALPARSAIVGPHVVTLITGSAPDRVAAFADSVARTDPALIAGIGTQTRAAHGIGRSYREAVACTSLLASNEFHDTARHTALADRRTDVDRATRIASYEQLRDRLAIRQIGDMLRGLDPLVDDSAARLLAHDRRNGTDLAYTIRLYLDHLGSVRETALALHVHQNTVRYRLDLLQRELGIDLTAPATRLLLWLRLTTHVEQEREERA